MIEDINELKWLPYVLMFLFVINPSFGDSNFANIQRMVRNKEQFGYFSLGLNQLISNWKKINNHHHRLQIQFDSTGVSYGCRASSINKEARPINTIHLANGCILAR